MKIFKQNLSKVETFRWMRDVPQREAKNICNANWKEKVWFFSRKFLEYIWYFLTSWCQDCEEKSLVLQKF